ncbi:DUF637 domain-containing protein [Burkholderia multivorans]|uniref:DUF637 domain-containing protein n=1 Tax=Burkholderia multivorans TaxID=87883 RepID=UPI0028707CDE|nr:DUF637 domain-containing protein [Burkholderia multivorans]
MLNAYWHSHWVQETGMFSSDKRHDIWACGTPEQCKALYGSAYTSTGGTIDPPTPVGNIAATIQALNLSISSNGQIQNVGNVLGTYVSLTGQKLINGITTANTYTPRVNAPSQVISLSPVDLPGLNLSVPRAIGTGALPTPVAGKASYVDASLGGSTLGSRGPQDLLNNLPPSLQPSSTLFYYNPQEEDLLLQQAALKQTGKSSFVDGLTYDSTRNVSVTTQEKEYLYQNAIDYSKAHDLQLGTALTQEQINSLDKPMLWYVEQTVPDPTCHATGAASCPTITALMPQVYLPVDTQAMSAGGNISGQDVTLKFNQDGNGSILNTGSITASGTLSVDTHTLTNQANQVDVGEIWQKVDGGYLKTTGTTVQPGGFMSAVNMDLNVQTLNQIGGALQKLAADGTIDESGTQQALAALQQQLGGNFTQTALSDNLHQDFVKEGGSFGMAQLGALVAAIAVSLITYGAASAAIGATLGAEGGTFAAATAATAAAPAMSAGLGNVVLSAAIAGFTSSAASQFVGTGKIALSSAFEAAAVAAFTAGLTNGITYNAQSGLGFTTQPIALGTGTQSLASLAGVKPGIGNTASQAMAPTTTLEVRGLAMLADAGISAGLHTAIEGGSFGSALKSGLVSDLAAAGAFAIGDQANPLTLTNIVGHMTLGCVASAVSGSGCGGGAIGGAVSAMTANGIATAVTGGQGVSDQVQLAAIVTATSLLGGAAAALLGQNALAAMTAAQNETLNNTCAPGHNCGTLTSAIKDTGRAAWNTAVGTVEAIPNFVNGALPGYPDYVPFLNGAMLPYDDPDFGSLVSLVGAAGAASLIGSGRFAAGSDVASLATADSRKFSDYIFATGADHGKNAVFESLGYSGADSASLTQMWEQQAAQKYAQGQYTLGKLDQYGQRINIEIALPGKGAAAGQTSYLRSGWMIQGDGSIKLNTSFSGFTRSPK